ncbi:MAG: insulinase family protein, partial [Gemmatimonadaceae bacterium]|nr:insulinase family protein [Chitinophagaceae bacterium]
LTIGYVEDLNRVNVNDLKNFFLRWYGPNNATLTVGGDVKTADVVRLVEKYFGSIPAGPAVQKVVVDAPKLATDRYVSYTDNYARLPLLSMTFASVPNYHTDMAALACLAQVLGQGRTSVFYQQLVKNQLALNASASNQLSELSGEFSLSVIPYPGKTLAEMEKLVRASLDSFEARGVKDEDIEKFKGGIEATLINGLQSVAGKVSQLAAFQTFTGNPNKIGELLKMYTAVTKEDVMRVYNEYIKTKHCVIASVLPKGQENLIAAADNYKADSAGYKAPDYGYAGLKYAKPSDAFERKQMPGNGANPVVKVPSFWKKNLPNGIKMIGTENKEVPTVNITISIPGGHLLQAGDTSKVGLAAFFAGMMNDDTKKYTAEQMAVELQKLGSSIRVGSDLDVITFSVQSLKKNLDKTLALLEERMLNPLFTEEAFKRDLKQRLESLKQSKTQPSAIASGVSAKINFGATNILGMSQNGTESTLKNITLEDIKNYYNRYMTSQNTRVVIVGDVKQDDILPKLGFLNRLPNRKIEFPAVNTTPRVVEKSKIYLVDVPKAAQTEFRVGYATGLKFDATGDFYKAGLMNYVLGGAFNSRINMNLREDKGWTYGARTVFDGDQHSGDFGFSSGIKAGATDSALVELMKELNGYAKNGITEDELKFMKSAVGQRDALRYETGLQKAGFIDRILEYNLPADFVDQQNRILAAMTKKDVDGLAMKYIRPEKINMVLVGDKAKILPGLAKLGYEIEELDAEGKSQERRGF